MRALIAGLALAALGGDGSPSEPAANEPPSSAPNPPFLGRPLETTYLPELPPPQPEELLQTPVDSPLGFAGPSGVLPSEDQESSHFVPIEDRWRIGFPSWDRYGKGHPLGDDDPYVEGSPRDPFDLNVLKGDYPIIGQHTFLDITATSRSFIEERQVPTATTPFESTARPFQEEFFGRPSQFFYAQNLALSFDLFHGDAAFKPVDWRVKVTPIFNITNLNVDELAVVNPNVLKGTRRGRTFTALEEYFIEDKISDPSPDYDFLSIRIGSQPFTSDFRGFIFSDTNRAVRLFGTRFSNQDQFNLIYFRQAEKDTNSELNTFNDRRQNILIANYYHQDFIFPGYTIQGSVHYNNDPKSFHFDQNDVLVRPDPAGVAKPHELNVVYLGWAGDGHIDWLNITHAFYWALGRDTLNPIANRPQEINAQMAALELSVDRDWVRFRTSFLWASGDEDPNNNHATGFDGILDNPNFAGGQFSFWQRQAIRLFGVNLVNAGSFFPDLRSSKIEGQSNFVNPGLFLVNGGVDFELTPKLRMINNVNVLWFDDTSSLETFTFDGNIHHLIGVDLSTGFEYRPLLSNNVIVTLGLSGLMPGDGFRDLYDKINHAAEPLLAAFVELNLAF